MSDWRTMGVCVWCSYLNQWIDWGFLKFKCKKFKKKNIYRLCSCIARYEIIEKKASSRKIKQFNENNCFAEWINDLNIVNSIKDLYKD